MVIKVSFYDKYRLKIECNDKNTLELLQGVMDGDKIFKEPAILVHFKAITKLSLFAGPESKNQFQFEKGIYNLIKQVHKNKIDREAAIDKIKKQYGNNPCFDYECKGIYAPLEHQKIMFNAIAYTDAAAILADPGTCKTAAYLWAIDKRIQRGQVKKALIITLAPLKENVLEEMKKQVPHLKGIVLNNTKQADAIINKKYKFHKKNLDYDVYIYNYESIFRMAEFLPPNYFDMVILDESHRIGDPRSRQTKTIIKLFDYVKYKYIITATLHANNLISFFMPFRFLGPDTVPFAGWVEFRKRFMYSVDPEGHIWLPSPGSVDEVARITGKISIMFKKEDCLDLPPLIQEKMYCEMEESQLKLYNELKNNFVAIIEDMCSKCDKKKKCDMSCKDSVSAKNALVLLTKLRQICCGFYINTKIKINEQGAEINESNTIILPHNPKLDLLMTAISCIPQDKKIIIWTTYIKAIELIYERLCKAFGENYILTCFNNQDAYDIVQKFKDPKKKIMVAMTSKMGVGQNIQFSNYQIFFNNSYSYILRDQALGRQHRQGQTEKVTAIDLIVKKSIDEIILESLMNKMNLAIKLSELAIVFKNEIVSLKNNNDNVKCNI